MIKEFSDGAMVCPQCNRSAVKSTAHDLAFDYAGDDGPVELHANVMLHECSACEFQYLDSSAEDAKHEAVCGFLGRLSPRRIKEIRSRIGTQKEFAEVTGIGIATIARWENGTIIQTENNDTMLRMIDMFGAASLGRVRAQRQQEASVPIRKFRTMDDDEAARTRAEGRGFVLRVRPSQTQAA